MAQTHYHGIPEHGLPLVALEAPEFAGLVHGIQAHPEPFGQWPTGDLTRAAVMVNQTGRAVVALVYFWDHTTGKGKRRASICTNLASSTQTEFLKGRSREVPQDLSSFILPGSKRLITDQGMFGTNLDVLPPQPKTSYTGYFGGGDGGMPRRAGAEEITQVDLVLDLAILEDGLCIGPDEGGLVLSLSEELELQHSTAQQVVASLRRGASPGQIIDMLLPLARYHQRPVKRGTLRIGAASPVETFAQEGIFQLTEHPPKERLAYFEEVAQSVPLRLNRPGPA